MKRKAALAFFAVFCAAALIGASPSGVNFSGTWQTQWGKLILNQSGDRVTGTYSYVGGNGQAINGSIEGKVKKDRLDFKWAQTPTYSTPSDAGDGYFIIATDGKKIDGKWRYGYSGEWKGDWNGTLLSIAPKDFSGSWNTEWGVLTIRQNGESVTGEYTHKAGKIEGTVSGDRLNFFWAQSPSYSTPSDAGDGYFIISTDGKKLNGKWRYGYSGEWQGDWSGSK